MKVKIKPISENFKMPTYGTKGAACFDLYSAEKITILPGSTASVGLGFKLELDERQYLEVRPRSGMSIKQGLLIPNSPGTCDQDYKGEIIVALLNTTPRNYTVNVGDRIAQGIIKQYEVSKFEIIEEVSETERGEGKYGSTGK